MSILKEFKKALDNNDIEKVEEIKQKISFHNLIKNHIGYNKTDKTFTVYKQDTKYRLYYEKEEISFYIYDLIVDNVITKVKEINDIITYKVN
ncbi:MAG: hypothetical protein ACRCYT_01180 [Cetobacterium sp.]